MSLLSTFRPYYTKNFKPLVIGTIIFATYIELSPGLGNIWFRTNVDGNKSIYFSNLLKFMLHPLVNKDLWHWSLLDTNYIFFITWWLLGWHYHM